MYLLSILFVDRVEVKSVEFARLFRRRVKSNCNELLMYFCGSGQSQSVNLEAARRSRYPDADRQLISIFSR